MQVLVFQHFAVFQVKRKTWKFISKSGSGFLSFYFLQKRLKLLGMNFLLGKATKPQTVACIYTGHFVVLFNCIRMCL